MNIGSEKFTLNAECASLVFQILKSIVKDCDSDESSEVNGHVLFTGSSLSITLIFKHHRLALSCKGCVGDKVILIHEIFNVVKTIEKIAVESKSLNSSNNYISGSTGNGTFRIVASRL